MIFDTKIAGIPCQCQVTMARRAIPYAGDINQAIDPPDSGEFDFRILDRKGYPAPWLETKLASDDHQRLLEEFQLEVMGERYGYLS